MTDNKKEYKPKEGVISPINQALLPVPGPGRPKGSKDRRTSPRSIKSRQDKEWKALCKYLRVKYDCDNPLIFVFQRAEKMAEDGNAEPLAQLMSLLASRRLPYAVDPDQADVAVRVAEIQAEGAAEGAGAGHQVNVILGQLGEYAQSVMAPPVDVEVIDVPMVEPQKELEAPPARRRPLPELEGEEQGPWEE